MKKEFPYTCGFEMAWFSPWGSQKGFFNSMEGEGDIVLCRLNKEW